MADDNTAKMIDLDAMLGTTRKAAEIGVTGLRQASGIILEEPLLLLRGRRGQKIYREMALTDDVVGAALLAIRMLVRQVPWWVEPAAEQDATAVEQATWLETIPEDMSHSWESFIEQAITEPLTYGWHLVETVYKRRNGTRSQPGLSSRHTDGTIGVRKLVPRAQHTLERWVLDPDGGVQAMVQSHEGRTYTIPIDKALLFRFGGYANNPEGQSALRTAWRSWYYKKRISEFEGIGIERDLAGIPTAGVPSHLLSKTASAADKALLSSIQDTLSNIRMDEQVAFIYPLAYDEKGNPLFKFELMSSAGKKQFDTDKVVNRYDRGIAGSLLADFILLGHEQHGSYALSSDKTSLFAVAMGSVLDSIAAVLNRHLVPRLFRLNGWDAAELPEWRHGDIERRSLEEVAKFIESMAKSGAPLFPDDALEAALREMAGLPDKSADAGMGSLPAGLDSGGGNATPAPTDAEVDAAEREGLA